MATTLNPELIDALRPRLAEVARLTVTEIMREVPGYARGFGGGGLGATIADAVQMALAGFLRLASSGRLSELGSPASPTMEGAYALGKGEAKFGRSADALLAAYRVGARVAWHELSATAVEAGVSAADISEFAELVFAYIDELSAASVAGHADHTESVLREQERLREHLASSLVAGASEATLLSAAEAAAWPLPETLTAVVVPDAHARHVLSLASSASLHVGEPVEGLGDGQALLLLADADRAGLLAGLAGRPAVVGPAKPWREVRASWLLSRRAATLPGAGQRLLDTDTRLGDLVLAADPEALAELQARVLAPLADLPDASREKLTETLTLWLLLQGRRDEIAAALFVHPQTVRYRVGQLRELYGDRLSDPDWVRDLVLALTAPSNPPD